MARAWNSVPRTVMKLLQLHRPQWLGAVGLKTVTIHRPIRPRSEHAIETAEEYWCKQARTQRSEPLVSDAAYDVQVPNLRKRVVPMTRRASACAFVRVSFVC